MRVFNIVCKGTQQVRQTKRRTGKKTVLVAGFLMALLIVAPIANNSTLDSLTGTMTTYAAEIQNQTPNWYQDSVGTWRVRDGSGNILKNIWFCDLDNSWYLLDESGAMREGIINDNGHYYSLETSHQGHYGKMRTVNGVYNGVYLEFNQEHTGTYGEIITGLQDLVNTGITITQVNGLPTTYVYAKDFTSTGSVNVIAPQQAPSSGGSQNNSNNTTPTTPRVRRDIGENGGGYTPGDESHFLVGG